MIRRKTIEMRAVPMAITGIILMTGLLATIWMSPASSTVHKQENAVTQTLHTTIGIDGVELFYRQHLPPALIVWRNDDYIIRADGAHPCNYDLQNLTFHLLDTGHLALEGDEQVIADNLLIFLDKNVKSF